MIDHDVHEPQPQPAIGPEDADRLNTGPSSGDESDDEPTVDESRESEAEASERSDGSDRDSPDSGDDASGDGVETEDAPAGPQSAADPDRDGSRVESGRRADTDPPRESSVDEEIPLETVCDVDGAEAHTLGELIDAAVGARTMYEVQSTLGVDADTTRVLLEACDLTDLVSGRIDRGEGPDEPTVRDRVAGAISDPSDEPLDGFGD